ncbi:unnamed protein product (macronuclear) [Paramecium tetraurelia]|uniref:Uncharacterized protein n=1 Tax=Paramecium tetraurelia TaxID=5888 RepID=A0BKP4_PARTE|nr:uncharacterized protein GSPATT00029742001 [Paramecium tetraurelia]CAK59111.1 unnamed protein product [Paramecium tetraurelia]|eukprot:XP_001426509.1 hypothetical protein (macronuclear) [Paramecium tetraurelia strain d4-2]
MSKLELEKTLELSDLTHAFIYKDLIRPSIANAFCYTLQQMPVAFTIYFLEQTQNQLHVATFGVGTIFYQAFGFSAMNGLASGLQALASQAIGAQKFQFCGKLYYQSIFIACILIIPISIILYSSEDIMLFMKIDSELAEATGLLNKGMISVILLEGIFAQTKAFLNAQNLYHLSVYTHFASCFLSLIFNYFFISILEMQLMGGIIARNLLELSNNLIIIYLIKKFDCCKQTLIKFDWSLLDGTFKFFKTALPIGCIFWYESICFELFQIQVNYLASLLLSLNVLMYTVALIAYQFSYGISIAATTFAGNAMGAKSVKLAKQYTIGSFVLFGGFQILCLALIICYQQEIVQFLTSEVEMEVLFIKFLPVLLIQIVTDGVQALVSGIVKVIGKEHFASKSMMFCYIVFGQPTAYLLTYVWDFELAGVWWGMIVAASTYSLLQIYIMLKSDWHHLSNEINDKIHSMGAHHADTELQLLEKA